MTIVQKISVNLWFDQQAEEAVNYYLSIFKSGKILSVIHYGKEGHEIHKMPDGLVMSIEFEIEGQKFTALNGGPAFKFNEAVTLVINCTSQEEIDHYWDKLTKGGDKKAQQCGWLKDKYGVSWQVVPTILNDLMVEEDGKKEKPVMKAMMQMKKLDIDELKEAARK